MNAVLFMVAAFVAWLVACLWARRDAAASPRLAGWLLVDALLVGLLVARLGYVLRWWPDYQAAPRSILAIGDAGFIWWAGLAAAVLFVAWRTRRKAALRRPVLAGIVAGMLAWGGIGLLGQLLRDAAPPLPEVELATLDGAPVRLQDYAGQPLVVNLWATWCPPCRREMPVLEHAQRAYPDVAVVLVNQGEGSGVIRSYLEAEGLELDNMLLDPHRQVMRDTGNRGLPTTLFFDGEGRLVHRHVGEISRAGVRDVLGRLFGVEAQD